MSARSIRIRITPVLALTVLTGNTCYAQNTLGSAVRAALAHDPTASLAREQLAIANEKVSQARAKLRPTLSFDATEGKLWERTSVIGSSLLAQSTTFNSDLPRRSYDLSLDQSLYSGGSLIAGYRASRDNYQASDARGQGDVQSFILQVIGDYIGVLDAEQVLELAKARRAEARGSVEQIGAEFAKGAASRGDAALAGSAAASADAEVIDKLSALRVARDQLDVLTGLSTGSLVRPTSAPAPPQSERDAETIMEQKNPILREHLFQYDASKENVRAARGAMRPHLTLEGIAERQEGSTIDVRSDQVAGVLVHLKIPLYAGGSLSSGYREAQHAENVALLQLDKAKSDAALALRQAWSQYESMVASIAAYRTEVSDQETALRGVGYEQSAGAKTFQDVLSAQSRLYEARLNLQTAQDNLLFSKFKIAAAIGTLGVEDIPETKGPSPSTP